MTDVVGLDTRLASVAAFVGVLWDAINDPLVGMLSDRMRSRWGRRRPFFLFFAVPFGLCFLLLWWAPPGRANIALMATITAAFMISDTMQTLVVVPFLSLTPELTPDYDERTSLTGFRMFFNLIASLITAAGVPAILAATIGAGYTRTAGLSAGGRALRWAGDVAVPGHVLFPARTGHATQAVRRRAWGTRDDPHGGGNVPFRFARVVNMLDWVTLDLVSLMLPFFLTYWIAQGNLLAKANVFGVDLGLQTAVLGILFIVAIICLPFWAWLARRIGKQPAFIVGMAAWGLVQLAMFLARPGQMDLILGLTVLAGICVSSAHVLPDTIFPDVVEWDELRTGRRHEGMYYGAKNFTCKLTGALAIFVALQVLGWFGYQSPPQGVLQFSQPAGAVAAIRVLTGPLGSLLMVGAIIVARFYPLTRAWHARIRALLARRQAHTTHMRS